MRLLECTAAVPTFGSVVDHYVLNGSTVNIPIEILQVIEQLLRICLLCVMWRGSLSHSFASIRGLSKVEYFRQYSSITCQRVSAKHCCKSHMHFKGKTSFLNPR
jgi:hypothetical protein